MEILPWLPTAHRTKLLPFFLDLPPTWLLPLPHLHAILHPRKITCFSRPGSTCFYTSLYLEGPTVTMPPLPLPPSTPQRWVPEPSGQAGDSITLTKVMSLDIGLWPEWSQSQSSPQGKFSPSLTLSHMEKVCLWQERKLEQGTKYSRALFEPWMQPYLSQ